MPDAVTLFIVTDKKLVVHELVHDGVSRRLIIKDAISCTDRELTDNDDRFSVQAIFDDRDIGLGQ